MNTSASQPTPAPGKPKTGNDSFLTSYFGELSRRLWLRRAAWIFVSTLAGALFVLLLARLLAALGLNDAANATLLIAFVAGTGGLIWMWQSRPSLTEAARQADAELAARARLATAAELQGRPALNPIEVQQLREAQAFAASNPPNAAIQRLFPRQRTLATGLLLALTIAAWAWLPDLSSSIRWPFGEQTPATVSAEPADNRSDLERNSADDLVREIDELRRRVAERSIDQAEAQRQAQSIESRLNRQVETSNREQQNLDNLADALRKTAAGQDIASAISRGDYTAAADMLNELARESDQLSAAAKRELAQALERAAQSTQQNQPLQQAERRSSQALNRDDYNEIERGFRNLGDQLTKTGRETLPQSEAGRANSRLQDLKQELGLSDGEAEGDAIQSNLSGQQGAPVPGGNSPGTTPGGTLPGNVPGQNQRGPGNQNAQPTQGGEKPEAPAGGDKSSDQTPTDGAVDRLGQGGAPLQLDGKESNGQLKPAENAENKENRGTRLGGARPSAGSGSAQPTAPVDSPADFTRVGPDRRPAIQSYFSQGDR